MNKPYIKYSVLASVTLLISLLLNACGTNRLSNLELTDEEKFWAFYRLSDSLYVEFMADTGSTKEYPVDIYYRENDQLLRVLRSPWYTRVSFNEDSLGKVVSRTVNAEFLKKLLTTDGVLFVKHKGRLPTVWRIEHGRSLRNKSYFRWFLSKAVDASFSTRQDSMTKAIVKRISPAASAIRTACQFYRKDKRGYYFRDYCDLNSVLRFRVRVHFSHPIRGDNRYFKYKSSINSIDVLLDLEELYNLIRRVDVVYYEYIPWSPSLPDELRIEYNGIPSEWDHKAWAKADSSLLLRFLYNNWRVYTDSTSWSVSGRSTLFRFRITHYTDSDMSWRTEFSIPITWGWEEDFLINLSRDPYPGEPMTEIEMMMPSMEEQINGLRWRLRNSWEWNELDSQTVEVLLPYGWIERALKALSVKKIEYIGEY